MFDNPNNVFFLLIFFFFSEKAQRLYHELVFAIFGILHFFSLAVQLSFFFRKKEKNKKFYNSTGYHRLGSSKIINFKHSQQPNLGF